MLPSFYLVGVIAMLCNREQKRLGDLVAGTIVVHERSDEQPMMKPQQQNILRCISIDSRRRTPREPVSPPVPSDAMARGWMRSI